MSALRSCLQRRCGVPRLSRASSRTTVGFPQRMPDDASCAKAPAAELTDPAPSRAAQGQCRARPSSRRARRPRLPARPRFWALASERFRVTWPGASATPLV